MRENGFSLTSILLRERCKQDAMVQTRSVKMNERIAKSEENLDVKFNYHEEVMKAFIQNLSAEFIGEIKKMFSEQFFGKNRG